MSRLVASSLILGLAFVCFVGGAFGVTADAVARRFGRATLLPFWMLTGVALGVVGTLRNLSVQRRAGVDLARVSVPGLYGLLIIAFLVVLLVPTTVLWLRDANPPRSRPRQFMAGAIWTLAGLFLAVFITVILDLANVHFIPIR